MLIYDFNDFSWDLWDKNKKVSVAVELLNRAYATKQFIFIVDNGACISPNGNIADWLIDILTNPLLYNFIGLFITSIQTPKSYLVRNRKDCLFVELHPLSESDRRTLFYAYARNIGLQDIDKDDVIFGQHNYIILQNKFLWLLIQSIEMGVCLREKCRTYYSFWG